LFHFHAFRNIFHDTNASNHGTFLGEIRSEIRFNEGFFSPGYWEEESTYLRRRSQIKISTVKDKEIDPSEPGHRPALVCIPATALLLGSGLIGFIGFKRRSKRLLND